MNVSKMKLNHMDIYREHEVFILGYTAEFKDIFEYLRSTREEMITMIAIPYIIAILPPNDVYTHQGMNIYIYIITDSKSCLK